MTKEIHPAVLLCFILEFSLELLCQNICFTIIKRKWKKWSICHKPKFSNLYILATGLCKPLIFQTVIILFHKINSLKYFRSKTSDCKDMRVRKFEFVGKTQFFCYNKPKSMTECIEFICYWITANNQVIKEFRHF